jgi:hypothetical protein
MAQGVRCLNHGSPKVTRKIGAEDYRLETDISSASSDMDPVDRQEEIRVPSYAMAPILVRYHASFYTALLSEQQFWHLQFLERLQSVDDLYSQCPRC